MALVVCCPCGNPLDCDNLELVVSLTCPRCEREILLELETGQDQALRVILTIMEGPHWVGERFVMPVGADLFIGKAGGNWLSLEGDDMSDVHCRLLVAKEGRVSIEDQNSPSGTWIADQRIVRGQLEPGQSFRVGEFRFRLDYQAADGAEATSPAAPAEADARPLPILARVKPIATPGNWLISNRFHVSRSFMLAFAWLMAIHHAGGLHIRQDSPWPICWSCPVGLATLAVLLVAARRVTLAHRYFKFAAIAVLVLLAVADVAWAMPVPAIAALVLAACLTMLIVRTPSQPLALFGALLGISSVTMMTVLAIQSLTGVIADCW